MEKSWNVFLFKLPIVNTSDCIFPFNRALHLAVINSQQEVIQCLVDVMAGLPESYVNEFNFLRQVSKD